MKCLDEFSTYLCRQNVIREDELVVVQYGLNMFIANLSAFAITMIYQCTEKQTCGSILLDCKGVHRD